MAVSSSDSARLASLYSHLFRELTVLSGYRGRLNIQEHGTHLFSFFFSFFFPGRTPFQPGPGPNALLRPHRHRPQDRALVSGGLQPEQGRGRPRRILGIGALDSQRLPDRGQRDGDHHPDRGDKGGEALRHAQAGEDGERSLRGVRNRPAHGKSMLIIDTRWDSR